MDSKAEYSALSSTRSQKKKLNKQRPPVSLWCSTAFVLHKKRTCSYPKSSLKI